MKDNALYSRVFPYLQKLKQANETPLKLLLLLFLLLSLVPKHSFAAHAISLDGTVKYPNDFSHFDYTSLDAKKGGSLVLHEIGSYDKMNPFTLKGEAPFGIESLVYEPLAIASLDEPFSLYGLLAKDIELAPDKGSVTFTIDERARFSNGLPVTAEDVVFTVNLLKSEMVNPSLSLYYQDIAKAEELENNRVKMTFARKNRELHLIAGQIRIMSKKVVEKQGFLDPVGEHSIFPPIGSGPYTVSSFDLGKTINYKRNPSYWAKDLPVRRGTENFDEIVVKYYKDETVALEAFKAGEFDTISINIAKQWVRDLKGPKFADGSIVKRTFAHQNNAGIQGFVMNTRKPLFQDIAVRKALVLALDFEWINTALFHHQYTRNNSYFSNSFLAAKGLPEGLELKYLYEFRESLPREVFIEPLSAPSCQPPNGLRNNLLLAKDLLEGAGWTVKNGKLVNGSGEPFSFEILLVSQTFERVMAPYAKNLEKLGIRVEYRTVDQAIYADRLKKFDFDMIVTTYGESQSPGNELRNYFSSSSADRIGSQNYCGIKSPVIDALVDKVIYANTNEELTAACRALDRVLWYGYYLVPNWYLPVYRLSYHNKFKMPEQLPLYYDPFQLVMTWWISSL